MRGPYRTSLLVTLCVAVFGLAPAQAARDDIPPPPPMPPEGATSSRPAPPPPPQTTRPSGRCENCGVIRSIREITTERRSRDLQPYVYSPEYRETRAYSPNVVGPVIGMTFGPGTGSHSYVGAMGSPEMQARMLEIVYEVIVRFDDGRFGRYELADRSAFRINDRVQVIGTRLEPLPR